MSEHIEKLAEMFKEFPGIGERQAKRFVYFLLTRHPAYLRDLSALIESIKSSVVQCDMCFRYFEKNGKNIGKKIKLLKLPKTRLNKNFTR